MKIVLFVILFTSLAQIDLHAQAEDNIWALGYNAALDFNSGTPVSLSGFMTSVFEGTVSIADADGNLLFYSAGQQVWNKEHNLMPNGSGILGHDGSGTQSVAICKYPGSDSLYYLFTLENNEVIWPGITVGYLRYNIIDMSLDGGLGDVIVTEKNIVLDSFMGEKMVVVNDDGCGYWLVTYNYATSSYHSYRITGEGIASPVISSGANYCGIVGEIKISPDRSKIANAAYESENVELASFDVSTGEVSGFILLDLNMSPYGVGFSPNSQVLYISDDQLYQYDLSDFPDLDAIEDSEYAYPSFLPLSAIRLATNGKLYFSNGFVIHAINEPDLLGGDSDLETSAVTLSSGSAARGMGTQIPVNLNTIGHRISVKVFAPGQTMTGKNYCIRSCSPAWFRISRADGEMEEEYTVHYSIEGTAENGTDYEWIPDQVTIPAGAAYTDLYIDPQVLTELTGPRTVSLKIMDTAGCFNNPIPVTTLSDTIFILDSIYVSVAPGSAGICKGESVRLEAESNYDDYLTWSPAYALQPSPNAPVIYAHPDTSVSYIATIYIPWSGCDIARDSAAITIFNETMVVHLDYQTYSDPVCIYDTILLTATGAYGYTYFNRFNDMLGRGEKLDVIIPDLYYEYIVLATDENGCLDSAVVAVQAEPCCVMLVPNAFSPNGDGVNDRFGVVTDGHPEEFRLEVFNRWGERVFKGDRPEDTWDGTYGEGTPADAGVYFYTVKGLCYDGDLFRKKGDLTLIR